MLCDYLHLLERWEKEYAPQTPEETWNPLFVEALQKKPYTEYLLDILLSGSMEERALSLIHIYTGNPAEKRIPCHTLIVILTERKCG